MSQAGEIDLSALIERQRLGWFRVSILLWSCAVMAVEGYDMQLAGFAAPAIVKAWNINKTSLTPVFGFGLFGYMLGASVLSSLADRLGRKKIVLGGAFWFGAFTLAAAGSHSISQLLALRFLAGLGLGAAIPTTIALAVEYAPSRARATAVGILFIGYNIGGALGGFTAARLMPAMGWPSVFYVGGIAPILLGIALIFALPESITFLALRHRESPGLIRIATRLDPGRNYEPGARVLVREEHRSGAPAKHLFTEGRAKITLLLWVAYICVLMAQHFLTSWLPTLLVSSGLSLSQSVLAGSSVAMGAAIGGLTLCWLIDRQGIFALVTSFAVVAVLVAALPDATRSYVLLMPLAFLIGFGLVGGLTGLNGLSGKLYPTYIRSTGVGAAFGVGRIGSILGPVLGGWLISLNPSNSVLFACVAAPVLCCSVALYLFTRLPVATTTREAAAPS